MQEVLLIHALRPSIGLRCWNALSDQTANADEDDVDLLSVVLNFIDEGLAVPAVTISVGL